MIEQANHPTSAEDNPIFLMDGFAARLTHAITSIGLSQAEFARRIGASSGFVSDVVRGHKKPGAEFLFSVRAIFSISIDWLLTGEGTLYGRSGIDLELLRTIRLHVSIARVAILDENPTARALLLLIRDGRLLEARNDLTLCHFLDSLVAQAEDMDLSTQLYNSHASINDPREQHRSLLAAAIAHFETQKPMDKFATLERASGVAIQVNIGHSQRNAGRDQYGR